MGFPAGRANRTWLGTYTKTGLFAPNKLLPSCARRNDVCKMRATRLLDYFGASTQDVYVVGTLQIARPFRVGPGPSNARSERGAGYIINCMPTLRDTQDIYALCATGTYFV